MLTHVLMLIAAASLASPAVAAQQPQPEPEDCCPLIAPPPKPIPPDVPGEEAMALARRVVSVVEGRAVAKRTAQLVALARKKEGPRPPEPRRSDGRIRAVPPVDLADYPLWGFVLQQRALDHAALFYARKYPLEDLTAMATFLESRTGRRLVEEWQPQAAELERELATDLLEDDLWNVVCGRAVPQGLANAPHHQFHRLHPPLDYPLPPAPSYCAEAASGKNAN